VDDGLSGRMRSRRPLPAIATDVGGVSEVVFPKRLIANFEVLYGALLERSRPDLS
jgi:hypothetical protein